MAFTVCRIGKLKGAKVAAADAHNLRTIPVQNSAGGDKDRRIYFGDFGDAKSLREVVDMKIAAGAKLRKDGVEAIEMLLGASPEYFRPDDPAAHGVFDQERMMAWAKASITFLKDKYGDTLVSVDVHCGEATPHIHAVILPLVEKEKKRRRTKEEIEKGAQAVTYREVTFDAKGLFGREDCRELQTSYAAALEHLGIERGLAGSKGIHTEVGDYYRQMNGPPPRMKMPAKQAGEPLGDYAVRAVRELVTPWMQLAAHYRKRFMATRAIRNVSPAAHTEALKEIDALKASNQSLQASLDALRREMAPVVPKAITLGAEAPTARSEAVLERLQAKAKDVAGHPHPQGLPPLAHDSGALPPAPR